MARRLFGHRVRVLIALLVLVLSVSVASAAGRGAREQPERGASVQGDVRATDALGWQVRFITTDGDVVSTHQLRVPHRGFRCVDVSYEDALTRVPVGAVPEPTGRVQLAVQAVALFGIKTYDVSGRPNP